MISVKNIVFGIAIFIVTIIVAITGINAVYHQPQYNDYCNETTRQIYVNNSADCEKEGGVWNPSYGVKSVPVSEVGYCDLYFKCNSEFETANKIYAKKAFYTAIPLGIIIIILGALVFGLEVVGAGLMAGGVGTIIFGITEYWRYSENWMRFLVSLIGLVALIFVAYWFNKKKN